jgi:2-polyprenyl-3-methyl-5-hydroxy-6-metoxy-1,4-benzoquinol methylase
MKPVYLLSNVGEREEDPGHNSDDLYAEGERYDNGSARNVTGYFLKALDEVNFWDHAPKDPVRIIDIGCGPGWLLFALARMFPGSFLYGMEPNPTAQQMLIETISSNIELQILMKGRTQIIKSGVDRSKMDCNYKFDLMFSIDVVEHVSDWYEYFAFSAEFLKPGGLHALTTPNFDSWAFKKHGQNWRNCIPSHLNNFDVDGISEIFREYDHEVIAYLTWGGHSAPRKKWQDVHNWWLKQRGQGDKMLIVARKK